MFRKNIFTLSPTFLLAFGSIFIGLFLTLSLPALAQESGGYGGEAVHCTIYANPNPTDGSTTLIWWSSANAVGGNIPGIGDVEAKAWYWMPAVDMSKTYTMTVNGPEGQSATCSVDVIVEGSEVDVPTCSLMADPSEIAEGGATTLSWTSENGVSAMLVPMGSTSKIADVSLDGSWYISGISNTRGYSVIVTGADGQTTTCDAKIYVDEEEEEEEEEEQFEMATCNVSATPDEIAVNGDTTLTWTSENAVLAKLHPTGSDSYIAEVDQNSSWYFSGIANSRSYSITVWNEAGEPYTCDAPIVVTEAEEEEEEEEEVALSCDIVADPSVIAANGATTLVWTSTGDDIVSAQLAPTGSDSYFADVTENGSWYIAGISNSRSYSLTVTDGEGNTATCDAPIVVEE